jgi:hypothetical protein
VNGGGPCILTRTFSLIAASELLVKSLRTAPMAALNQSAVEPIPRSPSRSLS